MDDNEIAIESGLRSEITEDFIAGLRNLFAENYINVPEDKVDLVEELATKVEELENKLNEEIETNVQYKKQLTEAVKVQLVNEVCEGLTATQVEKIKSLAESVEFSTEEEFKDKLETIRENYFPSGMKKADVAQLHETVDDEDVNEKRVASDPYVASVMQAISKTKI
jgi:exonuclease VII large subunit